MFKWATSEALNLVVLMKALSGHRTVFWGNLVSANELIIWTVYHRGTLSWRFEREATSRDVSFVISLLWQMYVINSSSLRQRAHAPNVTSRKSLRWPIYILNSVVKTKLSCNTPTEVGLQFLQRLKPFYSFLQLVCKALHSVLCFGECRNCKGRMVTLTRVLDALFVPRSWRMYNSFYQ